MKKSAIVSTVAALALPIAAFAAEDDDFFAQLAGETPAAPAPAAEAQPAAEQNSTPPAADSPEGIIGESMTKELTDVLGDSFPGQTAKEDRKRVFYTLPQCALVRSGKAFVLPPGGGEWKEAKETVHYPLGSTFRSVGADAEVLISFGIGIEVTLKGDSSFGTLAEPIGSVSRTLTLVSGTFEIAVPATGLPEGASMSVSAPGFKVFNLKGKSRYIYDNSGDSDNAVVRCITDSMEIAGRHFSISGMRAATVVRIRTSRDVLYTGIFGLRGDCNLRLDQGRFIVKDLESGEDKVEDRHLDWKLSPRTCARIYRAIPAVGDPDLTKRTMSVTAMTFNEVGEMKNRCAFSEGRPEINTGEMGPTSKKDREEIAKRAAQATETVSAEEHASSAETVSPPAPAAEPQAGAADAVPNADPAPSADASADQDLF